MESAPAARSDANTYPAGQYKIGRDFPAGSYSVLVPEGKTVYYEITTLPLCDVGSSAFVRNGNLSQSAKLELSDGQYVLIKNGSISS